MNGTMFKQDPKPPATACKPPVVEKQAPKDAERAEYQKQLFSALAHNVELDHLAHGKIRKAGPRLDAGRIRRAIGKELLQPCASA